MDFTYNTNFLYEIILKCAQTEFEQSTPTQVKNAHASLGLKTSNKKKDDLINDIHRFLSNILIKQGTSTQLRDGFPLFNHNNELFQRNPSVQHLIDVCNQKIHIANIHLAQINFNRLHQFKKSLNLAEGQSPCICDQVIDASFPKELLIKCINPRCNRVFHRECFGVGVEPDDYPLFECPDCVLLKSDPLHEVLKTLVTPFKVDNQAREFRIDDMISREIKTNDTIGVEIRVIRLENRSHEHSWPHQGSLEMNNTKLLEFHPLQHNSSLKKRKDERFFSNDVIAGVNTVKLTYVKGSDTRNPDMKETYLAGVYLVRKLTCEELVTKIKNENRRSVEDCKKIIVEDFKNSPVDINKVTSPLTCVYDLQPLKTPAKGAHCKHPNCFSLENYINLWYMNNQRKWTCPICKVKAYDLIVDAYFEEILEVAKNSDDKSITVANVEILRSGDYRFVKPVEEEKENNPEENTQVKVEKAQEKNTSLIVLDSDEEEQAANSNVNKENSTAMNIETENGPSEGRGDAMEEEKESPQNNEEGITSQNIMEKNDIVIHIREMNNDQSNGMAEEPLDQENAGAIEEEGETQANSTQINQSKEKSDKMIEETIDNKEKKSQKENELEAKQSNTQSSNKEKSSEREKEPTAGKESKKGRRPKQQVSPLEQTQQSEEYKLQQQLLQQYQQQQRMQLYNEALSLPSLMGNLQNLQGMGNLLGLFGNNLNLFPQMNPFMMNNLLVKLQQQQQQQQQQQVSRNDLGDLATLLLGGGLTDLNNPSAPFLRNFNELSLANALRMNMNGLPQIPGLNAANIQDLYLLQQQQQNKANDVSSFNARNINSPSLNNLSNIVKAPTINNKETPASKEVEDPLKKLQEEPVRPVVVRRRENNRPKVFTITREKPSVRVMIDAEKSLDKLIELSEKKLELPKFGVSKDLEIEDQKKPVDLNLQKNKKLVALVMKQFPLTIKNKAPKQTEGGAPETMADPLNQIVNTQMEIEEKEKEQDQEKDKDKENRDQNQLLNQPQSQLQNQIPNQQIQNNIGFQGQESDPICLE